MRSLIVYDPPMCCSTGVCGADVNEVLVRFAADLEWLRIVGGVAVRRFNLAQEPSAFMNDADVIKAVSSQGTRCLPLLVVDGQIVSRGTYPGRERLAELVGLPPRHPPDAVVAETADAAAGPGCRDRVAGGGGCDRRD